jgi:hypothetical protein
MSIGIRKSDIGRFIVWRGSMGHCVGRVESVRRGVATVLYPLRGQAYTHYIGVRDASLERFARATSMYEAQLANNSMYFEASAAEVCR